MRDRPILLLVDADSKFAQSIRDHFEASGFRVETCADADEAEARVPQLKPDVVVTEMILPSRSGFHVVEQLKKQDATLPVIMAASFGSPAQRSLAQFLGADDFLVKPVSAKRLLERVRRFCNPVLNPPHTAPTAARPRDAAREA